tara:strand:+ start:460 stop:1485 length:1026 start_codon:yes stop_codon:yes gene_type:complete
MRYFARAPLRLGLAGGGTDVDPYASKYIGNVLNTTINQYCYAIIRPLKEEKIIIESGQEGKKEIYKSSPLLEIKEFFQLEKAVYNHIIKNFNKSKPLNFHLITFADAPSGSGLGTSSTITVAMIKAFSEWLGLALGEYEVASIAFKIERLELGWAGGKQDQYSASFGGFNFMEFEKNNKVLVNPLSLKEDIQRLLELSLVLFYTGQSRKSKIIIEDQIKNVEMESQDSISTLNLIKEDAIKMKESLLLGKLEEFSNILNTSWHRKKNLAKSVSNNSLDQIYENALKNGAKSGKITGAGGGGFFMFYVDPCSRIKLIDYLSKLKGNILKFQFTNQGSISWHC